YGARVGASRRQVVEADHAHDRAGDLDRQHRLAHRREVARAAEPDGMHLDAERTLERCDAAAGFDEKAIRGSPRDLEAAALEMRDDRGLVSLGRSEARVE